MMEFLKKAAKNPKVQTAVIATATFVAGGVAGRLSKKDRKDKE